MNPLSPSRKRLPLLLAILVCAVAAGSALIMSLTGAGSGPGVEDTAAMSRVIQRWQTALDFSWPAEHADQAELSPSARQEVNASFEAALRAVGTDEFVTKYLATFLDHATIIERFDSGSYRVVATEVKVLGVQFREYLPNDDVVVRARLWGGDISQKVNSTGIAGGGQVELLDTTPVYQYQMRKTNDEWRIVSETLVSSSEDVSTAYGPKTRHADGPVTIEDGEGLVLDTHLEASRPPAER